MLSTSATPARSGRQQGGLWQYRALMLNFARRDLHARFKGTLLGFLWSLAPPLATLMVYSVVFGLFFTGNEPPPLGTGQAAPFPVWLFAGLVPWGMYAVTISTAIASLLGTGTLMKKIYFPSYVPVFGSVLATFYQSLIEISILVVVLLVLTNIGLSWLVFITWFVVFAVFVTSLALTVSVLNVYLRDTGHLVGVTLQIQFFLTPIIYQLHQVPDSWRGIPLRTLIEIQPMTAFIEVFRDLCYGLTLGRGGAWITMVIWSAIAAVAAWRVYRTRGLDLSEEL